MKVYLITNLLRVPENDENDASCHDSFAKNLYNNDESESVVNIIDHIVIGGI